jgi:hypothetical protein
MLVLANLCNLDSLKMAPLSSNIWGILCVTYGVYSFYVRTFVGYCNYSKRRSPRIRFEKHKVQVSYCLKPHARNRRLTHGIATSEGQSAGASDVRLKDSHIEAAVATPQLQPCGEKKTLHSCTLLFESHSKK